MWRIMAGTACALLALAGGQARASAIDTTPPWDHKTGIGPFGDSTTSKSKHAAATYGQTFTVGPTDTALHDFSFWVHDNKKSGPLTVEAVVMQWNGHQAVGPALWTSSPTTTSSKGGMQQLTFNPGNLNLQPGKQYVAFLTTSPFSTDAGKTARVGYTKQDSYDGGQFVYINNGSDMSKLTSTSWHHSGHGRDLAFRANLVNPAAAPVPSGLLLGVIGSGSLLASAWRGRRKQA
jgi:hypothetical protein